MNFYIRSVREEDRDQLRKLVEESDKVSASRDEKLAKLKEALRSKIEKDLSKPHYILTSWGVGYRFSESEEVTS